MTTATTTVNDDDFKVPVQPLSDNEKLIFANLKWMLLSLVLGGVVYAFFLEPINYRTISPFLMFIGVGYIGGVLWRYKRVSETRGMK